MALTVSVDQIHGVAGFPVAGNKVDLFITLNGTETVLLRNVSILAAGTNTPSQGATAQGSTTATTTPINSSGLYTFEVTPVDAERVALAEQDGLGIYMALVPPGSSQATLPPVSQGDIASDS